MRQVLVGVLFAALWSSASVATKFGIESSAPLVLANVRFFLAGGIMLFYVYVIRWGKHPLPKGKEWRQLFIFSLLNTTLYLAAFVLGLERVSAGIGSLSIATNPLFIMLLSAIWLRRRLKWFEVSGIILGLAGVFIAAYPMLRESHATGQGLLILFAGMISVSAATVYYASIKWRLSDIVINGWQVFLGGFTLGPVTWLTTNWQQTKWDHTFWLSVLWLSIPVSIVALQLWFYLVRQDPVKASLWLFLCPIFGYFFAWILMGEPITWFTVFGTTMVIVGLWQAQREKLKIDR
jgi:probable blue pigment (indigoidine) exporter